MSNTPEEERAQHVKVLLENYSPIRQYYRDTLPNASDTVNFLSYRAHPDPGFILGLQKEELARIRNAKIFFAVRRFCFIVLLLLILFNSR